MAAKKQTTPPVEIFPLLKTVEQMSKIISLTVLIVADLLFLIR